VARSRNLATGPPEVSADGGELEKRAEQTRLIALEKGRKPMTRRQFVSKVLGAGLLLPAVAIPMSGCDGDGQPARGTISAGPKGGAKNTASEEAKAKATTKGKLSGRGGL
jgi:hypothetical protein